MVHTFKGCLVTLLWFYHEKEWGEVLNKSFLVLIYLCEGKWRICSWFWHARPIFSGLDPWVTFFRYTIFQTRITNKKNHVVTQVYLIVNVISVMYGQVGLIVKTIDILHYKNSVSFLANVIRMCSSFYFLKHDWTFLEISYTRLYRTCPLNLA